MVLPRITLLVPVVVDAAGAAPARHCSRPCCSSQSVFRDCKCRRRLSVATLPEIVLLLTVAEPDVVNTRSVICLVAGEGTAVDRQCSLVGDGTAVNPDRYV